MILEELHIRDFALIEEAWIELGPGMTVLTGETGAGKTVLLAALKLLMGERADLSVVRTGAAEALVEGRFSEAADEILVRRRLTSDGRSKCALDGEMATVGALAARIGPLVDLHGQHEHQSLLSPASHCRHLDRWAAPTIEGPLGEYRRARSAWQESIARIEELTRLRDESLHDEDRLRRLTADVDAVAPQAGEDEEIESRLPTLKHAEILSAAADAVAGLLRGDGGAFDVIASAEAELDKVSGIAPELDGIARQLREAAALVDDAGSTAREYRDGIEHDPAVLEAALARIAALAALKRAYGPTLAEVLTARGEAVLALSAAGDGESLMAEASAAQVKARATLEEAARGLDHARRDAVEGFEEAVHRITDALAMTGARIEVAFTELGFDAWTADGPHRVEFMYAPAASQPARPLARIASGGEISRVMLALKGVAGDASEADVLVFDEVDAGIGGATATAVGARLAELALHRQVVVVTHLAQVAAFADAHIVVRKVVDEGSAVTAVLPVEGEQRLSELARMLSGNDSEASRAHAAELLQRCAEERANGIRVPGRAGGE